MQYEKITLEDLFNREDFIFLKKLNPYVRINIDNELYEFTKIKFVDSFDSLIKFEGLNAKQNSKNNCVYLLIDYTTGKFYVGGSTNAAARYRSHKSLIKLRKHYIDHFNQEEVNFDRLQMIIIYIEKDTSYNKLEKYLIDIYWDSGKILNIAKGSSSSEISGFMWKQEKYRNNIITKIKRRMNDPIIKQRYVNMTLDRWKDEEYKNKMSEVTKKRWANPAYKKNIVDKQIGRPKSEKTKLKISKKAKERAAEPGRLDLMTMIHPFRKRVSIDGIIFESQNKAAKSLNVDIGTIRNRILSKNKLYKEWKYI